MALVRGGIEFWARSVYLLREDDLLRAAGVPMDLPLRVLEAICPQCGDAYLADLPRDKHAHEAARRDAVLRLAGECPDHAFLLVVDGIRGRGG